MKAELHRSYSGGEFWHNFIGKNEEEKKEEDGKGIVRHRKEMLF